LVFLLKRKYFLFLLKLLLPQKKNLNLLYSLLKIYTRLAIHLFCREIKITNKQFLKNKGPLLLAVNHPNSFLDAVILDTLFDKPVYSLARGDAFNKKWIARILKALKILPVYREREGKEHLHRNYHTFDACIEIFKKDGIVLIFTEALCENEWHLRPLKKGAARLAATAWEEGIPLQVLPIGLNYSSFRLFGKNVHVNIGSTIIHEQLNNTIEEDGKLLNEVTENIDLQLKLMVYEIDAFDKKKQAEIFSNQVSSFRKILLAVPAAIGCITHSLLYWPVQKIIWEKCRHTGHYDSIVTGLLVLLYPLYLLGWAITGVYFTGSWYCLLVFVLFPFFAWSYVQLKQQTDR
jgi:1-acyl-sn-glycerol-3-phosphate acyltransferase